MQSRTRPTGAETTATIIRVATEIFAEDGYADVSLRDIADRVGITPPAIYLYFNDKRRLYVECCRIAFLDMTDKIAETLKSGKTPAEQLRDFVHTLVRQLLINPNTTKLFQRELIAKDHEILSLLEREAFEDTFNLLIQRLHEATGTPPSALRAASIHALILGIIQYAELLESSGDQSLSFKDNPGDLAEHVLRTTIPELSGK